MILDSKNIKYEIIDITEPGREDDKDFMQNNSKSNGGTVSDPNPRTPLPPQVFNDVEYCGVSVVVFISFLKLVLVTLVQFLLFCFSAVLTVFLEKEVIKIYLIKKKIILTLFECVVYYRTMINLT